jgi:hypothetical protein
MDDRQAALREKLERLLAEAAEVEVELSRTSGAIVGIPHYSVIEGRAHDLGRRLSQKAQQRQMAETAATAEPSAKCPACGTLCQLEGENRPITSIDGVVPIQELKATCPSCRRAFFPSSDNIGLGCR